ncbi:MAG: NAD(P)-binding domain-containing protein, partial [Succinivibrio sp.]
MDQSGFDISVIGAGSYGTALAVVAASKGLRAMLWDHRPERAAAMQEARENASYLPGIRFPDTLEATGSLEKAAAASKTILVVVPSATFKEVVGRLAPLMTPSHRFAWAT